MKSVLFHTLGCRLNMAETALAADDLTRHGYRVLEPGAGEVPDCIVVNSCAVTGAASQKSRQAVRALRRKYPSAFFVLMGCDATIDRASWEAEGGPQLVVPHPTPAPLSTLLARAVPGSVRFLEKSSGESGFVIEGAARFAERTRANLKIQDGCDFCCTYCAIPAARGPSRSRLAADVFREAAELAQAGYRELVLCGVNISMYNDSGLNLATLLKELAERFPCVRFRVGSAEPGEVIDQLADVMASHSNVCRFLHLPLQYGNNRILEKMGRLYSAEEYATQVLSAAEKVPGICIGADVITGFPGETETDFRECRSFLEALPMGLLHVFPFSPRPGTVAASLPGRPDGKSVEARTRELIQLGARKAEAFADSQLGKEVELLVEEEEPASGWTDHYLHLTLPGVKVPRNSLVRARLTTRLSEREVQGILLT